MTYADDPLDAVYRRDVDDIEIGCGINSKSYHTGGGLLGGFVVHIDNSDEGLVFHIVRFHEGQARCDVILEDDVDLDTVEFNAAKARAMSTAVHQWAGRQRRMDRHDKVKYDEICLNLDKAGLAGTYTPKAEQRFADALEARRDVS